MGETVEPKDIEIILQFHIVELLRWNYLKFLIENKGLKHA